MKHFFAVLLLFFIFLRGNAFSILADSTISSDKILSGTFANDATFRTDYYFTQGMTITLVHPALAKSPVNLLLFHPKDPEKYYFTIKLLYDGFTPLRIADPNIRYGDRPYASYIYAVQSRICNNFSKKQRLTSGLQLGIIGPATGAKGFQTKVHEWLDAPKPMGWDYQIQNDLIIGYETGFEKQLLAWPKHLELIGQTKAALSTLNTFGEAGIYMRTGKLNSYFQNLGIAAPQNRTQLQQFQFYAQGSISGRLVGYNALLQGGLLNKHNPYTLKATEISRTVLRKSAGLACTYKGVSFESSVVWISPEFKNARSHKWMSFVLGFVI